jgi:hypothetical protein
MPEGKAKKLTKLTIERGEAGDAITLKPCIQRYPVRRERPVPFKLPPVEKAADHPAAIRDVMAAAERHVPLSARVGRDPQRDAGALAWLAINSRLDFEGLAASIDLVGGYDWLSGARRRHGLRDQ